MKCEIFEFYIASCLEVHIVSVTRFSSNLWVASICRIHMAHFSKKKSYFKSRFNDKTFLFVIENRVYVVGEAYNWRKLVCWFRLICSVKLLMFKVSKIYVFREVNPSNYKNLIYVRTRPYIATHYGGMGVNE